MILNFKINELNENWVNEFKQKTGRSPKILHIGNIANNAYLNAKILNKVGIENHVLSHDYYHIMGCPEWEDSNFTGNYQDDFFPKWYKVCLNGFNRPEWFAQGSFKLVVNYLLALNQNKKISLIFYHHILKLFWFYQKKQTISKIKHHLSSIYYCMTYLLPYSFYRSLKKILSQLLSKKKYDQVIKLIKKLYFLIKNQFVNNNEIDANTNAQLSSSFSQEDIIHLFNIKNNILGISSFKKLLNFYDAVIGYGTDGRYPLLSNKFPYFAFEHGTLRAIPFETTIRGRLCALTYQLASSTFITNADNIVAAKRLGLKRYIFIPHPINEDGCFEIKTNELRKKLLAENESNFILFHPSRHHWDQERNPDWEKGNDILIKGFARFVHEVNINALAIFVEWGKRVKESKILIQQLGISSHILWIKPQPNKQLLEYIQASDVLADQFYLGAFGSTLPKALLLGCPCLIYLNEHLHEWCLPEMPPVLNAKEENDVFYHLKRLMFDWQYKKQLAESGKNWYQQYHSNEVIANQFLAVFRETIIPNV